MVFCHFLTLLKHYVTSLKINYIGRYIMIELIFYSLVKFTSWRIQYHIPSAYSTKVIVVFPLILHHLSSSSFLHKQNIVLIHLNLLSSQLKPLADQVAEFSSNSKIYLEPCHLFYSLRHHLCSNLFCRS